MGRVSNPTSPTSFKGERLVCKTERPLLVEGRSDRSPWGVGVTSGVIVFESTPRDPERYLVIPVRTTSHLWFPKSSRYGLWSLVLVSRKNNRWTRRDSRTTGRGGEGRGRGRPTRDKFREESHFVDYARIKCKKRWDPDCLVLRVTRPLRGQERRVLRLHPFYIIVKIPSNLYVLQIYIVFLTLR